MNDAELEALRERALERAREGHHAFRSCWNCNPAHQHLTVDQDWLLECFGCGHYYFQGVDITIMPA